MEGGIIYGLSAALKGEITIDKGRVVQSHFGDYQVVRMPEMPVIDVHIVPSTESPGGIGEPSTAVIAGSLVNAVFAATGKRIYSLPITLADASGRLPREAFRSRPWPPAGRHRHRCGRHGVVDDRRRRIRPHARVGAAAGVIVKLAITEGGARWQLATGSTLVEGWRNHLPASVLIGFFIYFVVWSYAVSSALVAASALVPAAIWPSVPIWAWGLLHALAAFAMVYYGRYEKFLAVIKWFIGLKFGAIMATVPLILLWSGADWSRAGASQPLSTPYILSLIGGVGGTVTLLSYGYWMREEGWSGRSASPLRGVICWCRSRWS